MVGVLYVGIFYKVKYSDKFYPNGIINIIGNISDIIICTIRGVNILYITSMDICSTCIFNTTRVVLYIYIRYFKEFGLILNIKHTIK